MFVINMSGIDHEVDINFFTNLKIKKEDLIGDTYFVTIDQSDNLMFSIHKINYEKIKRDLLIEKILN
jgi:hypothetical protein